MLNSPRKRVALGAIVAAIVLSGVALALTGGQEQASPTPTSASTTTTTVPETTTTTVAPIPLAPLTGLPVDDPARLMRAALVVKIDNLDPQARPQVGLNQADVVYEERVEGSVTRLLAVFHSTDSVPVGPVRSARTSDIAIVSALNKPYFAWSGANATFAARVRASRITDVGYDVASGEYFREGARRIPHNLMLRSTSSLMSLPADGAAPPPPLFPFRAPDQQPAHLEPIAGVSVNYGFSSGSAPVEYRWNGTGWARSQRGTPHVDTAGVQVAPENVILQFVTYAPTDVADQFGVRIPEAQLIGEGDALVLTAGGQIPARWHKPSLEAVTTYTDVEGNPIPLTPGQTWIALPSPGGASRL